MKNIKLSNDVLKLINKERFYSEEHFINDAKRYIKAIKEGRIICAIGSVSSSGMSRTIKFLECSKSKKENRYRFLNFWSFFRVMGFTQIKDSDYFRINGCGMDMIFHSNYTNIHFLYRMNFITKKQCEVLAQMTPTIV